MEVVSVSDANCACISNYDVSFDGFYVYQVLADCEVRSDECFVRVCFPGLVLLNESGESANSSLFVS